MLSKLSEKITGRLIRSGEISSERRELYEYGFFMLISKIVYFMLALAAGLIFRCEKEMIIFYVSYILSANTQVAFMHPRKVAVRRYRLLQ